MMEPAMARVHRPLQIGKTEVPFSRGVGGYFCPSLQKKWKFMIMVNR